MKRLEGNKQVAVATALSIDPGTFSKIASNAMGMRLFQFRALLRELGLKVVDEDTVSVDRAAYLTMTRMLGTALQARPEQFLMPEDGR